MLTRPDNETVGAFVFDLTFWSLSGFVLGVYESCQCVCRLTKVLLPTCQFAIAKTEEVSIVKHLVPREGPAVEVAGHGKLRMTMPGLP